jgi:hypothetical protein
MLTFIAIAALGVLLWVAVTAARTHSAISELQRNYAWEAVRPDVDYPAFSRDQTRHAYDQLDKALKESLAAEEQLFTAPGWNAITSGERPPDQSEEHLMHESALTTLTWEIMLSRCQFLMEANLRVKRGDWTIAQAHYYYRDLEPFGFEMEKEVQQMVDKWRDRFQHKHSSEEIQRDYSEQMRPYESERADFLQRWRTQFKAMHASKPIYVKHTE